MGKYEPLGRYLQGQSRAHVPMTFKEIERILGSPLPASKEHRAWWSNNPSNNVMTKQWLDAGYETEQVDIEGQKLVFRKVKGRIAPAANSGRAPIFGCMKGMITIASGVDLTEPLGEVWEIDTIGGLDEPPDSGK